jgi:hypothetical protein
MPHATEPTYKHITVTPLAPTFAAKVSGVDFSKPVPDEVFQEILAVITIVRYEHFLTSIFTTLNPSITSTPPSNH